MGSKIDRLCKHDECELKKRLTLCKQYKIFTAFCEFIPKCRSWRIVDAVKDKKRNKEKVKMKKRKAKNKSFTPSWDSNHDRLCGKQGSLPLDYCIIWLLNNFIFFVQISVHRMGEQE